MAAVQAKPEVERCPSEGVCLPAGVCSHSGKACDAEKRKEEGWRRAFTDSRDFEAGRRRSAAHLANFRSPLFDNLRSRFSPRSIPQLCGQLRKVRHPIQQLTPYTRHDGTHCVKHVLGQNTNDCGPIAMIPEHEHKVYSAQNVSRQS
jgi:hypothetical protein